MSRPPSIPMPSASQPESVSEEDVQVARKLYYAGFAFLPWLWLLSAANFWSRRSADPRLRAYVLHSLVGFFVSTLVLVVWILVFQLSWRSWGSAGEALLVVPYNDPSAW